MGQIKIFGLAYELNKNREEISEILHSCVVDALKYPKDKKFHRFFPMESDNFYFPKGRTEKYTIIEISIFETPKHNWGIRGLPGDELQIDYKVNV